jgi:hypothetical protein
MATTKLARLEARIATLETELTQLKDLMKTSQNGKTAQRDWLDDVWGSFANDPLYEKAMELGRRYRESLRPKPVKKRASKSRKRSGGKRRAAAHQH